jgi:isocitrate dehydrogenase
MSYDSQCNAPTNRLNRLAAQLRASQVSAAAATQEPTSICMGPDGELIVPNFPIIPFIEGDGTGPDIWNASVRVLDAAVAKAYGGSKKIAWLEVLAGEKAFRATGNWLPEETIASYRQHLVGIKGRWVGPWLVLFCCTRLDRLPFETCFMQFVD